MVWASSATAAQAEIGLHRQLSVCKKITPTSPKEPASAMSSVAAALGAGFRQRLEAFSTRMWRNLLCSTEV